MTLSLDRLLLRLITPLENSLLLLRNIILNLFTIERLLITLRLLNLTELSLEKRLERLLLESLFIELLVELRLSRDQLLNIILRKFINLLLREIMLKLICREREINM